MIIAHMMKTLKIHLKIHFEDAWQYVCSKCWHLIDQSLVYEDQLQAWERMYGTPSITKFRMRLTSLKSTWSFVKSA